MMQHVPQKRLSRWVPDDFISKQQKLIGRGAHHQWRKAGSGPAGAFHNALSGQG